MKIIGHRGACGYYPENTLLSIAKAIEMGVDGIEFDVRATSDKVVILFHDERLDRLTGVKGFVHEKTYEFISRLKVRGEKIPRLSEVLEFLKKYNITVFIEIKDPEIIDQVVNEIENYGLKNRVYIISFYHHCLKIAKNKGFKIGFIFVCRPVSIGSLVSKLKPDIILPRIDMVDKDLVNEAKRLEIEVGSWVINDEHTFEKAKKLDLDWIATDYPDRVKKMFKQLKLF